MCATAYLHGTWCTADQRVLTNLTGGWAARSDRMQQLHIDIKLKSQMWWDQQGGVT